MSERELAGNGQNDPRGQFEITEGSLDGQGQGGAAPAMAPVEAEAEAGGSGQNDPRGQ